MQCALKDLGHRICIIGPSNSGKSTLADRLGSKIGAKVCHLDQIAHKPNTNWERRPDSDFVADHDAFIAQEKWVVEGNYSVCMPQRFAKSTSVIWLDPPLLGFLWRYINRALKNNPAREGNLEGATQEFSWQLIKFTFFNYPKNRSKYSNLLLGYPKPMLRVTSMKELNRKYQEWGLKL